MKCLAPEIHPRLRENLCGRKRVTKNFPCCLCALREEKSSSSSAKASEETEED